MAADALTHATFALLWELLTLWSRQTEVAMDALTHTTFALLWELFADPVEQRSLMWREISLLRLVV